MQYLVKRIRSGKLYHATSLLLRISSLLQEALYLYYCLKTRPPDTFRAQYSYVITHLGRPVSKVTMRFTLTAIAVMAAWNSIFASP